MSYKNINPDISEIKTGTPAIKIGDKYVVGGIGGNFIPQVEIKEKEVTLGQVDAEGNFQPLAFNGLEASNSGTPETVENYYGWNGVLETPSGGINVNQGGSTVYYKCVSVDTASKTWTGYKAVLGADGTYTFEETVTTGLSYVSGSTEGYTPVVGTIYNSTCTVWVKTLKSSGTVWDKLVSDIRNGVYTLNNLGDTITVNTQPLSDVNMAYNSIEFEVVAVDNATLVNS